jgi:uncharacterized protein
MLYQHFFMKLLPPRPTFAADMTDSERAIMQEHIAYIQGFFTAGSVLAFGPVLAPEGAYGMAILEMPDIVAAEAFAQSDPSIRSGLNTFQISPMHLVGPQPSRGGSSTPQA